VPLPGIVALVRQARQRAGKGILPMELLALTTQEWNFLIAGIIAVVLGIVILIFEPALRIIVALWLFISGAASIIWALSS
jgi:uncharacterized membrane protein HdeD (DUF308 family)